MSTSMYCFAEVLKKEKPKGIVLPKPWEWEMVNEKIFTGWGEKTIHPFDYSMYAFFADVRNYDHCQPLSQTRGLPKDLSSEVLAEYNEYPGQWSESYFTLKELLDFDYDQTFWNRRIERTYQEKGYTSTDGAALAEEGEGKIISYRDNLGENYFKCLEILKTLGEPDDVRIVFSFDN